MRVAVFVLPLLLWSMSARAQQPLVECFNSYDCCVQKFRDPAACGSSTDSAARRVVDKVLDAAEAASATSSLSTAIDGESVNSLLVRTGEHLARILELEQVGGVPPGEPPDGRNNKHWWREIKTFVRNIRKELKRCRSRSQLMSAIQDARNYPPRTLEQIADIEARLVEASTKMGETVDELLPCH